MFLKEVCLHTVSWAEALLCLASILFKTIQTVVLKASMNMLFCALVKAPQSNPRGPTVASHLVRRHPQTNRTRAGLSSSEPGF